MKQIIVGMEDCPRCKMLKEQNPEAEYVNFKGDDMVNLLVFARIVDIKSMPFVITVGEPNELNKVLKI